MTRKEETSDMMDDGKDDNPQAPSLPGIFLSTMLWGLLFGIVGFLAGFFGPIVLRPNWPQGPLLGIFITGPLGIVVGSLYGASRARRKR